MGEVAIDEALLLSRLTRLAEYFSVRLLPVFSSLLATRRLRARSPTALAAARAAPLSPLCAPQAHPASFGGAAVLQALHGKPVVGDVETPVSRGRGSGAARSAVSAASPDALAGVCPPRSPRPAALGDAADALAGLRVPGHGPAARARRQRHAPDRARDGQEACVAGPRARGPRA